MVFPDIFIWRIFFICQSFRIKGWSQTLTYLFCFQFIRKFIRNFSNFKKTTLKKFVSLNKGVYLRNRVNLCNMFGLIQDCDLTYVNVKSIVKENLHSRKKEPKDCLKRQVEIVNFYKSFLLSAFLEPNVNWFFLNSIIDTYELWSGILRTVRQSPREREINTDVTILILKRWFSR